MLWLQTFLYIINFDSITNNITKFQEVIFRFGRKYVLIYSKKIFHDKALVTTLMKNITPRKLISRNINFGLVYLEFLNALEILKKTEKISNILSGIRYYNWNNSSVTATNSIFLFFFSPKTGPFIRFPLNFN